MKQNLHVLAVVWMLLGSLVASSHSGIEDQSRVRSDSNQRRDGSTLYREYDRGLQVDADSAPNGRPKYRPRPQGGSSPTTSAQKKPWDGTLTVRKKYSGPKPRPQTHQQQEEEEVEASSNGEIPALGGRTERARPKYAPQQKKKAKNAFYKMASSSMMMKKKSKNKKKKKYYRRPGQPKMQPMMPYWNRPRPRPKNVFKPPYYRPMDGYYKPIYRPPRTAPPPGPYPTKRPPYNAPTITTVAPTPAPVNEEFDFSDATVENPIVAVAIAPPNGEVVVDLTLPDGGVASAVYLIQDANVDPGTTCPPPFGQLIPTGGADTLELTIEGSDQIVCLCRDGFVVAVSYYVFEDFENVGGSGGGDEVCLTSLRVTCCAFSTRGSYLCFSRLCFQLVSQ